MRYRPHEYQQYAIEYIETHPVSAVLLDMGLGKTSITLTALGRAQTHRFLNLTLKYTAYSGIPFSEVAPSISPCVGMTIC